MINYFVVLMLLILLAKQITFIRKIQIRTKKSTFEIGVFSVALNSVVLLIFLDFSLQFLRPCFPP